MERLIPMVAPGDADHRMIIRPKHIVLGALRDGCVAPGRDCRGQYCFVIPGGRLDFVNSMQMDC